MTKEELEEMFQEFSNMDVDQLEQSKKDIQKIIDRINAVLKETKND